MNQIRLNYAAECSMYLQDCICFQLTLRTTIFFRYLHNKVPPISTDVVCSHTCLPDRGAYFSRSRFNLLAPELFFFKF